MCTSQMYILLFLATTIFTFIELLIRLQTHSLNYTFVQTLREEPNANGNCLLQTCLDIYHLNAKIFVGKFVLPDNITYFLWWIHPHPLVSESSIYTHVFRAPPKSFSLPPQTRLTHEGHFWHKCVLQRHITQPILPFCPFLSMRSLHPFAQHIFGAHRVNYHSNENSSHLPLHAISTRMSSFALPARNSFLQPDFEGEPSPRFGPQTVRRASFLVQYRGVCSCRQKLPRNFLMLTCCCIAQRCLTLWVLQNRPLNMVIKKSWENERTKTYHFLNASC